MYYEQRNGKWGLLGICYSVGHSWLKVAQVVKRGKILGVTAWSHEPQGHQKNTQGRVPRNKRGGRQLQTASLGAGFLFYVVINCELLHDHATAFQGRVQQETVRGTTQVCAAGAHKIWSFRTQLWAWDKNTWSQSSWTQSSDWNQGDSDCLSVWAHWRVGEHKFSTLGLENGGSHIHPVHQC